MQQRVELGASQSQVSMSAGGAPVSVTLTLANRSQVVDQYDLTVEGGQADWYELSPARVSLFPGESTRVTLLVHPPRRENVLAGSYNLAVRAISRDDSSVAAVASIGLIITPSGGFRLEMVKARDVGRQGSFSARAVNLSDAPLSLNLGAHDPETALVFYFPAITIDLAPYEERLVAFTVRAKKQPFTGEQVSYQFTIVGEPQLADRARAAQDAQRGQGEFVFRPRLKRWPWASLPRLVSFAIPATGAVAALAAVLVASGAVGGDKNGNGGNGGPDVEATIRARDAASSATALVAQLSRTPTPSQTPSVTPTPTVTTTAVPSASPTITRTSTRTTLATRTPTRTPVIFLPPGTIGPIQPIPPLILPTFSISP